MRSRRAAVAALAIAALPLTLAFVGAGDIERLSVKNDGSQSPTGGFRGVVSGDGRHVVFLSAEDLTGTPTGGKVQVYIRDAHVRTTKLVSVTAAGAVANDNVDLGEAFNPSIDVSVDGRFVVFASTANNLVDGDTNNKEDVFRKDMVTGELVRISVTASGEQGNDDSNDPSVSGDGSRIAFRTFANNILPGVSTFGVALRDTIAGTTTLVSSNSSGVQANDFAESPSISADGSTVAFEAGTATTNLYPNDTNNTNDIIVKNLATGTAVPAAVKVGAATTEGADVLGGNRPDISGTGRFVVFQTSAILDPANDANAQIDVYRRDLQTGTTTLVSARDGLDAAGNDISAIAAITADGERGAFASAATNLITTDTNAVGDIFARTFSSKTTIRLSERGDGTATAQGSETTGISGNGALGVFTGQGAFVAADTNGATDDVYGKGMTATDTTPPVVTLTGTAAGVSGTVSSDPSGIASVRVDGRVVRLAADGTFSAAGPFSGNLIGVEAIDGAGNPRTASVDVTPPVVCCVRASAFAITRVKITRRTIAVTVNSVPKQRVRAMLQRVITRKGKTTYIRTGPIRSVSIKEGLTTFNLARPKRPGRYRVRVTGKLGDKNTVLTKRLVIR